VTPTGLYTADRIAHTNGVFLAYPAAARPGLRFSADGRYLVCAASVNGTNQVYLEDFATGATTLVSGSLDSSGPAYGNSDSPDISAEGRFVAYRSSAMNLTANNSNSLPTIILYDSLTGTNRLLTVGIAPNSGVNNRSFTPFFSQDGRSILFQSWASDLVAQDFNQMSDLYQFPFLYAAIVPTNNSVWVTWPFLPGNNYRVEYKTNLSDSTWQVLAGTWTNLVNTAYQQDSAQSANHRFYRVVAY
jgi:hypothetical protein